MSKQEVLIDTVLVGKHIIINFIINEYIKWSEILCWVTVQFGETLSQTKNYNCMKNFADWIAAFKNEFHALQVQ